jgi:hypothetical protein
MASCSGLRFAPDLCRIVNTCARMAGGTFNVATGTSVSLLKSWKPSASARVTGLFIFRECGELDMRYDTQTVRGYQ